MFRDGFSACCFLHKLGSMLPSRSRRRAVATNCCPCQEGQKGSVGAVVNFHAMLTLSASESVLALG